MGIEHEHCSCCYDCNCTEEQSDCAVASCRNQCGSRFHACKEDEHILLCPRELVACVNLHNGCPFSFERSKLGVHLAHCPASIVCCSHTWFRRNKAEAGDGICPDPVLPTRHLDFALARRDQERVGGDKCLRDLTVSARPVQRQCPGICLDPREDAPDTLTAAIFFVHVDDPPALATGSCLQPGADGRELASLVDRVSAHGHQLPIFNHLPPSNSNTPDATSICSRSSGHDEDVNCTVNFSSTSCRSLSNCDTTTSTTGFKTGTAELEGCTTDSTSTCDVVDQSSTTDDVLATDGRRSGSPSRKLETLDEDMDSKKPYRERSDSKKGRASKTRAAFLRGKRFGWRKAGGDSIDSLNSPSPPEGAPNTDSIPSTSVSTKFRIHLKQGKHRISKAVTGAIGINRLVKQSSSLIGCQQLPHDARLKHMALERSRWSYSESVDSDAEVILVSGSSAAASVCESSHALSPLASRLRRASGQSPTSGQSELQKERWEISSQLSRPTSVLDLRDEKLRLSAIEAPLLFELSHFFAPRHISPADGLVQCQCSKFFRRDEIAGHQEFVHAGVDSVLTAHLFSERCPMAAYGCEHIRQALVMPQGDWKLRLTKQSLAIEPSTLVTPQDLQPGNAEQPDLHLTTFPVRVLQRICAFLDPLSLTCVAETCTHLRQLVSSVVQQRGMVCPVWERSETEDGDFAWTVLHYKWTLSTHITPVPLHEWQPSNEKPLKEHLQNCDLLNSDRYTYGHQWKPLLGLTDVDRLEVVGDSDEVTDGESDDGFEAMAGGPKPGDRTSQPRLSVSLSIRSGMAQSRRSPRSRSVTCDSQQLAVAMDDCDIISDDDCGMGEEETD